MGVYVDKKQVRSTAEYNGLQNATLTNDNET